MLRRHTGRGADRWSGCARADARLAAVSHRPGTRRCRPVLRNDRCKHRLWPPGCDARTDCHGGPGGAHRGVRQHSAGRVSDGRRCARTDAVRRATPTHRPGPGATAPAAVVDHGRPDLCRGCGHRMRNSGGAAGGDRGSHRGHFHPPPIHAYLGRPGRGPRLRAPARCRHPRRGVGALSPLSGIAVARAGSRR
ncbi:Uncharacterised protein [Mycobacterium tuberculosis]|nr:Uncharacterised protein [Mycobacterium tuberculosis]